MALPAVSVLLPVLNEEDFIETCLESLIAQDYEGDLEIIVADGGSSDRTRQLVKAMRGHRPVTLVVNPGRLQSHGINRAAEVAGGTILVRADAHTSYAPDYVARSVEGVLSGAFTAAGGPMRPRGVTAVGRSIADAMTSPLAVGPAKFHHAATPTEADTVYLGAFRKDDFHQLRLRSFPSGVAEDADFYFRWRKAGGRVLIDPRIVSWYVPRQTFSSLWLQHFRYGKGKAEMLYANGVFPSARPLAPLLLVMAVLTGGAVGLFSGEWRPLAGVLLLWGSVLVLASLRSGIRLPLTFLAGAVMHMSYGLGLMWALTRGLVGRRRRR